MVSVLTIISGVILLILGFSLVGIGAFFALVPADTIQDDFEIQESSTEIHALIQFLGGIGIAIGSGLLAISIGYLIVSYGLLKGTGWSWTVTIILLCVGIAMQIILIIINAFFISTIAYNNTELTGGGVEGENSLISAMIGGGIGLAINGVILYYLYRPYVKTYFGKHHLSRSSTDRY